MLINKTNDEILPYTYLIKFKIGTSIRYYYGVRYGNVRLNIQPSNDLFKKYFTSSNSVKNLINDNVFPYEIIIHKTFINSKEACEYEVKFLTKLNAKDRKDFLNQANKFDNSLPYNNGRVVSKETKQKISEASSLFQSTPEYKEYRRKLMTNKWANPDYVDKMKESYYKFIGSDKQKEAIENMRLGHIGKLHTNETKQKMSKIAIEYCSNIDCHERAMNRKRYKCHLCDKSNLDGGNFNSHMISKHNWEKDDCVKHKKSQE